MDPTEYDLEPVSLSTTLLYSLDPTQVRSGIHQDGPTSFVANFPYSVKAVIAEGTADGNVTVSVFSELPEGDRMSNGLSCSDINYMEELIEEWGYDQTNKTHVAAIRSTWERLSNGESLVLSFREKEATCEAMTVEQWEELRDNDMMRVTNELWPIINVDDVLMVVEHADRSEIHDDGD